MRNKSTDGDSSANADKTGNQTSIGILDYAALTSLALIGISSIPFPGSEDLVNLLTAFNPALFTIVVTAVCRRFFAWQLLQISDCSTFPLSKDQNGNSTSSFFRFVSTNRSFHCFIGIVSLLGFGLWLRMLNLSALGFLVDEGNHLHSAFRILKGEPQPYERGKLVSYMVAFFFNMTKPEGFAEHLYWARFPSALFNMLIAIPLYFLGARISRTVGLLSVFLWAICPWAIGVAKYTREYSYYPLFVVLMVHFLILLTDQLPRPGKKAKALAALFALYIVAVALYAIVFDRFSTLKIGIVLTGMASIPYVIALIRKAYNRIQSRRFLWIIAGFTACVCAVVLVAYIARKFGVDYKPQIKFPNVFLSTRSWPTTWWTGFTTFPLISYFLVLAGFCYSFAKGNKNYFVVFSVFAGGVLFYYLFFNRYFKPRYCFYLLPFFTILVSAGIRALFAYVCSATSRRFKIAGIASILLFLFAAFNISNTVRVTDGKLNEPDGKKQNEFTGLYQHTSEFHQDTTPIADFLKDRIVKGDVFVTTIFRPMMLLEFDIEERNIHYFNTKGPDRFQKVEGLLGRNDSGWMILDYRRHGRKKLKEKHYSLHVNKPFYISDKEVRLLLRRNGIQIYHWGFPSVNPYAGNQSYGEIPPAPGISEWVPPLDCAPEIED